MERQFDEWKIILSSPSPLNNKTKMVLEEMLELVMSNQIKLDLFDLYRSVTFKNDSNEFFFIKLLIKFIDRSHVLPLRAVRSLVLELSGKNKFKQIMEFIPSHITMLYRDKTTLEINFSAIFSQIKFYILLLVNETGSEENRNKVAGLTNLCLNQIVALLKYSIKIQKSTCFIEILKNILTPQFKLFQILLRKYNKKIYENFVTNLVNELVNGNYSFALHPNEIENFPIYYLFTRLFVELFSEKICIEFSLNLFKQLINDMMMTFSSANKYISSLLKNFAYFGEYLKTFNNFEKFVNLSSQLFDTNELTYDFLVTICEIISRIETTGLVGRAKAEHLNDFTKIFEFLAKYLISANITKTFCSHCTNVKRHSLINYGNFYVNLYRNLCKTNYKFCNEQNLAKTVNIIKYNFTIWSSFQCSTASHLFDVMFTAYFNFVITLSNTTDLKLNETAIVTSKILLKHFKNNQNTSINIENVLTTMLRGFNICYANKPIYLEFYCFFVLLQMQRGDVERNILIGHVQRIVQQFWTDESTDNYPSFNKVLDAIGDSLYEIPKPTYDKIDVVILVLETVSNYRLRTNIRLQSLQELFQYANPKNYVKIGEFLSTYKYIDQSFASDLTNLYDKLTSLTTNSLLLGLLNYKIFVVNSDKITETKKSIAYEIDFATNLGNFDNEKISNETKLLHHLFESLDYLSKFILNNIANIKDLKYENLVEILHSIGQNFYFRDYKVEATNAFGLLLALSLEVHYEDGIIDGLNYFLNNYQLYQMFLNYSFGSRTILKMPDSLEDLLQINNNIINARGKCDEDRVLINYLNYSKYLIDMNRTDEFFKIIKMFLKLTNHISNPTNETKFYHLKLILLIVYYKINNDNEKNNSFTIFKYIMQYFLYYKNVKYTTVIERLETYNLLFDTMEYVSDFIISKRLFYEKDFFLLTIIKFAIKVDAMKRLLSFLRFSIKLDILMESFSQIDLKVTCFNKIVENKCYLNENINDEFEVKSRNAPKNIALCNNEGYETPKTRSYTDCTISRNYNIHIDQFELITQVEPPLTLNFEIPKLHQLKCKCMLCSSDLRIRLLYLEVCLLIAKLHFIRKQNKESKDIFQYGLYHLNFLKTNVKNRFEFSVNFDYYQLTKINLYESLAYLYILDKDYMKAKNLLLKAKNNYNLTNSRLPIGLLQNILIQLKFVNQTITSNTFVLSTIISPSYDLAGVQNKNENSIPSIFEPVLEHKKRSPKVKCITIKKPTSSLDSLSSNSENEHKIKKHFVKETTSESVIEIIDSPVKKNVLTTKSSNVIGTNEASKPRSRNGIARSPQTRTLRTRAKR